MATKAKLVSVQRAADAGIDCDARWATVCEQHNTIVGSATRKLADAAAANTADWCDGCRATDGE